MKDFTQKAVEELRKALKEHYDTAVPRWIFPPEATQSPPKTNRGSMKGKTKGRS